MRAEANDLWAALVRAGGAYVDRGRSQIRSGGSCVDRGRPHIHGALQAAHGFPKGAYPAVRYDLANGFCLCASAHRYYTTRFEEWRGIMQDLLGPAAFAALRERALAGKALGLPDMERILGDLRAEAAERGIAVVPWTERRVGRRRRKWLDG